MNSIKYNKLIRDKIPEIIEKDGKQCVVEIMDEQQYLKKLVEKLQEETKEFIFEFDNQNHEQAIKELADLEEVILSIVNTIGLDNQGFEKIRLAKKNKNGGFEKRLLLKEVIEE